MSNGVQQVIRSHAATVIVLLAHFFCSYLLEARASTLAPPVEDFFRPAAYARVALAPDGKTLAAVAPVNGYANLVAISLHDRKVTTLTSLKKAEVAGFRWINNRRLVFEVIERRWSTEQRIANGGLYAIDRDGQRPRDLRSMIIRQNVSQTDGGKELDSDDVIAEIWGERSYRYTDIARVDTVTGQSRIVVDRTPGEVAYWRLDRRANARAAVTREDKERLTWALHYREDADKPWRKLVELDPFRSPERDLDVVTFDYNGNMIVSARPDGDRAALYYYDVENNRLAEKIAEHPRFDVGGGLIFDRRKRRLVGIRIEAEKPEFLWVDADWARWHETVNRALPGRVNSLVRTESAEAILVFSYSDQEPGTYFLFDPVKSTLEELVRSRPWIDPKRMAERRPLSYKARDGLSIPAYLTLPAGSTEKGLPLVVLVHGGPFVRGETWGWDPESQFLASRGYAVLQPDFRGSLGYGFRHYRAGWKQWGRAMQDDLNDGVAFLAGKGTIDPKRVCIMGASYGGYAALLGLARDPEVWRCGISFAGVSDLELMVKIVYADYSGSPGTGEWHRIHVGDAAEERALFEASSPVRQAHRIKSPVLLATGSDDRRVPMENSTRMRSALRRHGVPHEWLFYESEVHGFSIDAYLLDFYRNVERFLERHLGNSGTAAQ